MKHLQITKIEIFPEFSKIFSALPKKTTICFWPGCIKNNFFFSCRPIFPAWNCPGDFAGRTPPFPRPSPGGLHRRIPAAPPWWAWRKKYARHTWDRWILRPEAVAVIWQICLVLFHGWCGSAPPGWRRPSRGSFPPVQKKQGNRSRFRADILQALLTQFSKSASQHCTIMHFFVGDMPRSLTKGWMV